MKRRRAVSTVFVVVMVGIAALLLWQRQGQLQAAPPQIPPAPMPLSLPLQGAGRPASSAERKAVIAAITAQLNAFRKDDYVAAFTYQADALKRTHPSPDSFRQMIQRGYPQFAHYKTVQFGPAYSMAAGRQIMMNVTLTGQDGVTIAAAYLMVREKKAYRIQGVSGGFTPPPSPPVPTPGLTIS